ncbi:MAG: threonine--tRNA ligase [Solirubrobacteraceae bacterium]|nr:MAG: threonine--tRNA ligase [Solirubrobacterales bacterium]
MHVTLPDGKELELPDGATGADAAATIGPGLARAALAIRVDGELRDLSAPLADRAAIAIVTARDEDALALIRHDAAHVLATAVTELYPGVQVAIGPAIAEGFYYDFDFAEGVSLSDADFVRIEAAMAEHIAADEPFDRREVSVEEGLELFRGQHQRYKVELIEDLVRDQQVATVSLYRNGPFTDLCRGPHGPSTGRVTAFKLQSVAGAYWRGRSDNPMLTRVYGTAFFTRADLDAELERLEQARARDHRRLGRELDLFTFSARSPGSAFWLPPGTRVFNRLVALSREMAEPRGYTEVKTPQLYDAELYRASGHWGKYRENMFITEAESHPLALKPMNCPGHCELYGLQRHSYRELPVRYSEPGLLHRNEPSGTLHGLLRVRHFVQDDAHIFCSEQQVPDEVAGCLELAFSTYEIFGLEVRLELSTRPEQRIGDDALWDRAEQALQSALTDQALEYELHEGDGAFYGPKIDFHMTDSLGRSWQLGTVQLDYQMPAGFGLAYTGADDAEHQPVMIHRALFGSYERFIGVLLEHTGGELPLWLAPVQAIVLPIADRHLERAEEVRERLAADGLWVEVDGRSESVGRKIRDAELRKVPVMLIVGDREVAAGEVAVRAHRGGDLGAMALDRAVARLRGAVEQRAQGL